jgi:hypothetical protein
MHVFFLAPLLARRGFATKRGRVARLRIVPNRRFQQGSTRNQTSRGAVF